jgi:NAD(P)-dependent dehydrogenase (short-subunit alcohol dehydrogenase family)/acyl carrier protein
VGTSQTGAPGKLRDWLYDLCWEEKPRTASAGNNKAANWTIFADAGGFGSRLAHSLRARGITCTVIASDESDLNRQLFEGADGIVYACGLDDTDDPCALPLRLVKKLAENPAKERAFWILTRGTQAAGGNVETLTPAAELWGFAKVLALEHSELNAGIIDLGSPREEEENLAQVVDELLSADAEKQLAFRRGLRFAARLRSSEGAATPGSVVLRPDATYLITGGLGGLGLAVGGWMVERGARRLILAGRTPLPPRQQWRSLPVDHPAKSKVEAIRDLERRGASVHVASFDVSDAGAIATYLDEFDAEGWPSVRGIIHAAGIVDDQFMVRLDEQSFQAVLRPKVAGALALHRATLHLDLDFFTLFSSVSSVLGQFGQASYAAGNAFMDHLAHWRRSQGLCATSINWGPWAEVGLFARLESTDKTGRSGVFPFLPEQGLQAMEHIHALAPAQVTVVSADWSRMPPSPLLSELASHKVSGRSQEEEQAAATMLLDLLLADPAERQQRLEEYLTTFAAHILRLDPAKLDPQEPLTTFGMDSIMVVELKHHIETNLNLSIPIVELFTGSIVKLAEQLVGKLASDTQLEELLKQVENMSPQEVEALLGEAKDQ